MSASPKTDFRGLEATAFARFLRTQAIVPSRQCRFQVPSASAPLSAPVGAIDRLWCEAGRVDRSLYVRRICNPGHNRAVQRAPVPVPAATWQGRERSIGSLAGEWV